MPGWRRPSPAVPSRAGSCSGLGTTGSSVGSGFAGAPPAPLRSCRGMPAASASAPARSIACSSPAPKCSASRSPGRRARGAKAAAAAAAAATLPTAAAAGGAAAAERAARAQTAGGAVWQRVRRRGPWRGRTRARGALAPARQWSKSGRQCLRIARGGRCGRRIGVRHLCIRCAGRQAACRVWLGLKSIQKWTRRNDH